MLQSTPMSKLNSSNLNAITSHPYSSSYRQDFIQQHYHYRTSGSNGDHTRRRRLDFNWLRLQKNKASYPSNDTRYNYSIKSV